MPRTAHLALATLPILLRAARRWQDAHAGRSELPAPRRPLGTLGIWRHGTCQQRNAQGERTGPTALRKLEGSPTAPPHAATTQAARVAGAAYMQRVWRRHAARTHCIHAALRLQAALRRRGVIARLHARHNAAACTQRAWRRRVAHTRCVHAALLLQAALRRRAMVARLYTHATTLPPAFSVSGAAAWHTHAACTQHYGCKQLCANMPW